MSQTENTPDLFAGAARARQDATPSVVPAVAHEIRLHAVDSHGDAIGTRLRNARIALHLEIAECAERLHLPIKVLERLEFGDLGAPDHFVFLRGPLTSYAKLLGVPAEACTQALRAAAPVSQPALTSVARVSHTRWLLQRYGTATTYIVLTAFIAVPLVLLGLRGGLDRAPARIVSLDQAPAASAAQRQVATTPDATPFRASIAPFDAMGLGTSSADAQAAAATSVAAPAVATAGAASGHSLKLTATADCWYEITDASGASVASGLLHAGDTRTVNATGELHVTLGNADAVRVERDGAPFATDAFKRANVARFDVFGRSAGGAND